MKKLMKIPFYVPFLGILLSFVLFIIAANNPNDILIAAAVVIFFLCGWIMAIRFFLGASGFFSMVLDSK